MPRDQATESSSEWWRGKGLLRILMLLGIAAALAALAGTFGVARDYGYPRASILSGAPADSITQSQRALPNARTASVAGSPWSPPRA